MKKKNIIIMGAAGRDFHNFNVVFRDDPSCRVRAFTAAQIPFIAGRRYPPSLAGKLYPSGIPIFPETELGRLLQRYRINEVVFAYSDIAHLDLMHKASFVVGSGADFRLIGPDATMLKSRVPVISVCAVRTGCGKSQVTRYLCGILREEGIRPIVVRHPMPYGDLSRQAVERFAHPEDLLLHRCTIEEREEYEPLLSRGAVVFAGIDYLRILNAAEEEGEVIIWDGGNNDFPFFRPDLEITVADPLRAGDETSYYPGEVNLIRADVVVINKINAAAKEDIRVVEKTVGTVNPTAQVIKTASRVTLAGPADIRGMRVLVIEDGPTVTHGGMAGGAGLFAARAFLAGSIVDPRPHAVGSIAETFRRYPHIGPVLPAMGYSPAQTEELRQSIESAPADMVLSATPIDIGRIMNLSKPVKRVFYDIEEEEGKPLRTLAVGFLRRTRAGAAVQEKTLHE
ncbi:MAG TPA: cyclic 2,3-diphosphoglycerate synthase [Geobacteraceae bacterium]|nr:cyclic 2,3-diphosphoglycerate synthase [Geobacteraceae bacterium]